MMLFEADRDKCMLCGDCMKACPRYIVKPGEDGYPVVTEEDEWYCIRCGHCVINCRFEAANLSFYRWEDAEDLSASDFPSQDEARRLICTRRSTRSFKSDRVESQVLMRLMDMTRYAPSASNKQPVRWIVVQKKETMDELKRLYEENLKTDSSMITDKRYAVQEEQIKSGLDPVFRGAPMLVAALVPSAHEWPEDAAIALSYFEISAHSMGIGTCWAGFITRALRKNKELRKLLGIGDDEWVGGATLFGYPALKNPARLPLKKELELDIR
jgi:nitroreductase/NAD-dependent dihydropyrimidine dehydrogenase PreA subunit